MLWEPGGKQRVSFPTLKLPPSPTSGADAELGLSQQPLWPFKRAGPAEQLQPQRAGLRRHGPICLLQPCQRQPPHHHTRSQAKRNQVTCFMGLACKWDLSQKQAGEQMDTCRSRPPADLLQPGQLSWLHLHCVRPASFCSCRIPAWLGLEGKSGGHPVQPLLKHGHRQPVATTVSGQCFSFSKEEDCTTLLATRSSAQLPFTKSRASQNPMCSPRICT